MGGSFFGSTPGNKACNFLYNSLIVSARSSSGSSGFLSSASSFLVVGDDVEDVFCWTDFGDGGGADMIAGWAGIWEDGLWDRSAMAARYARLY